MIWFEVNILSHSGQVWRYLIWKRRAFLIVINPVILMRLFECFFLILRDWWPHKNDWSWFRSDAVNNKILKIKPILKRVRIQKMSFAVLVTHILEFLFNFYNWILKVNVKVFLHCGNEYSDKWTNRFFKSNKLGFIVLGRDTNGICSLIDVLLESLFIALLIVFWISY